MTIKILQGDCIEVMRTMDAESVDCVVTSPPYWGLRDYGVEGQMGLEPTLGEHLEVMVNVFAEIHRILKPTGTVWLNYGDCYATTPNGKSAAAYKADKSDDRTFRDKPFSTIGPINRGKRTSNRSGMKGRWGGGNNPAGGTLKPKDLCMIPNRLAIALQDWGWWVRSEIIWAKPNPMPESVTDRPASSHEKIFLLTKSSKYFYDAEAVKEPCKTEGVEYKSPDGWDTGPGSHGSFHKDGREKGHKNLNRKKPHTMHKKRAENTGVGFRYREDGERPKRTTHSRGTKKTPPIDSAGQGHEDWCQYMTKDDEITHRNLRNVWHIGTKPFSEAHFATFPPQLAATCIKAGCPRDGVVFDPFGGAGTTSLVADQLQLDAILIELNPEYIDITKRRLVGDAGLFSEIEESV